MFDSLTDLNRLTTDSWINLATAIAAQAILDARSERKYLSVPAREWLLSPEGVHFLELLNLNPEVIRDWLENQDGAEC